MSSGNDFTPAMATRNESWNQGYSDGYRGRDFDSEKSTDSAYSEAYEVGKDDAAEDQAAMDSGDFDGLSDSEREAIYGDESDQP